MPTWLQWLGWLKGCLFSPLGFVLQLSRCLPALTNFCVLLLTRIQSPLKEGRRAEMTFGRLWSCLRIGGILWHRKHLNLREREVSLLREVHLDFLAGMLLINELGFDLIQLELLSLGSAKRGPTSFPSSPLSDPWEEVQKWIWLLPPHNLGSCKSFRHVLEALSETAWKFRFF